MKIHHIGIIVKDIEKSISLYIKLGYILFSEIVVDLYQYNKIVFLNSDFSPSLELIEPISEASTVYNFKEGYHHICFEVDENEDIFRKFNEMKVGKIFTKSIIAPALNGREVLFACLRNGTFVEFII